MKEITQEEFESIVKDIIVGKKSKAMVIKELHTEARTLNNKIQELSMLNPELYEEFVKVKPYKPKERKDVNIVGFVTELLTTGVTMQELADKYHIGVRTISRKIAKLEKSDNPKERDLYNLYKSVARKKSHSQKLGKEEEWRMAELEAVETKGMDNIERRRQELLKLEKEYEELYMQVGKVEAAKRMGYSQNRIYKLLNELYRIEIERNAREHLASQGEASQKKEFKESLKVDVTPISSEQKEQKMPETDKEKNLRERKETKQDMEQEH